MATTAPLALEGIRVLDFTWVVAGPVATRILADHGAEVIKLERKPGPLGSRQTGLQGDLHRNKRSIAVNMGTPGGIEIARRLVQVSDIVMDNFSARVMRSWGMDYESLKAVKPDIICISMSGLGHTGPLSSYVSYGPTLQALVGYTHLMAEETGDGASGSLLVKVTEPESVVGLLNWSRAVTIRPRLVPAVRVLGKAVTDR